MQDEVRQESNDSTPSQAPLPAPVPNTGIILPGGYLHKDGKVYRDAEVSPMTGLTRKAIAGESVRNNPVKTTDIILAQCLRRIGPITTVTTKLLGELLNGDREFLLLEIRRISMGDTITAFVDCDGCENKIEVKFKIDELETIRLKDGDFQIKNDLMVFRLQSDEPELNILCRFPRGYDQEIFVKHMKKNPIEALYKVYQACVLEWNGGTVDSFFFDSQNVNILDKFGEMFEEKMPGPILKQTVPCPVCAKSIEFTFQNSDFLHRLPKRGMK